jgi:hypothetical protein
LQESEHRLSDLRQSVQKIQGELERLLERREQMGVQLHELGEEARRLEDEAFIATERLGTIVGERASARTALAEAERSGAERSAAVLALEAETERHRTGLAGERDRLEALRLEQMRVAAERVDLMREAGELRERQVQLARRAERLALELAEVEAEAERPRPRGSRSNRARSTPCPRCLLAAEREELVPRSGSGEPPVARGGTLAQARRLWRARSSRDALRELELARGGTAPAFARCSPGSGAAGGIVGTVAGLLESSPGWSALSKRSSVAYDGSWSSVSSTRAPVAWLHERTTGSATFLPLERLGGRAPARRRLGRLPVGRQPRRRSPRGFWYLLGQVASSIIAHPAGHARLHRCLDVRHAGR